jgi:AraC-like DNA-binding protein
MLFRHYKPKAPLSDFVDLFWYYDGYSQPHKKERLMPDGSVELVINLREDESRIYDRQEHESWRRLPGAIVSGPQSNFFVIDTAEQASVIGIHFKPGGAFPFFKLPLDELQDQQVALCDLWGTEAGLLRERLLEAHSPEEKLRLLESCLLTQSYRSLSRHPAVGFALQEFARIGQTRSVTEVSDQTGLSARRFIQLFSGSVGLNPKLYCRIGRFQQVLRMIHSGRECDWTQVALECGYFDQAHFIHDFKAFSGINPSTYLEQRTEHLNHVPIPD